jgi:hypothetical protein
MVTANKITDAIKALARVTEALSAWLLFAGGRSNSLMPVAQFNPFERLIRPSCELAQRPMLIGFGTNSAASETDILKMWT